LQEDIPSTELEKLAKECGRDLTRKSRPGREPALPVRQHVRKQMCLRKRQDQLHKGAGEEAGLEAEDNESEAGGRRTEEPVAAAGWEGSHPLTCEDFLSSMLGGKDRGFRRLLPMNFPATSL
jgi:hypothetical protein